MTGRGLAVPPGRAGRIWLDRRLAVARRGADLLDRKLRVLQAELGGLAEVAARTREEWQRSSAEADRALLIASLLGGQRAIRLATGTGWADVRVASSATVGVRHPAGGSVTPPAGPGPWAGPAVEQARLAHSGALAAAVRHAVAAAAVRAVEAEAVATRHRLRAVTGRLIPALEQARAGVVLAIDEIERADGARLRLSGRSARRWDGSGG